MAEKIAPVHPGEMAEAAPRRNRRGVCFADEAGRLHGTERVATLADTRCVACGTSRSGRRLPVAEALAVRKTLAATVQHG